MSRVTYTFDPGFGSVELDVEPGEQLILEFGEGFSASDIRYSYSIYPEDFEPWHGEYPYAFGLSFGDDRIVFADDIWPADDPFSRTVLSFSDGTTIDLARTTLTFGGDGYVRGSPRGDVIEGTQSDNFFEGDGGNDIFRLADGFGSDTIASYSWSTEAWREIEMAGLQPGDVIELGAGVDLSDLGVRFKSSPSLGWMERIDLILRDGASDLTISDFSLTMGLTFRFADGTLKEFGKDIIEFGGGNHPALFGTDGSDRFDEHPTSDVIWGGLGDDVYMVGHASGDDVIWDIGGQDRIVFADGISAGDLSLSASSNIYRGELEIVWEGGSVTIKNSDIAGDWYSRPTIEFADGSVLDRSDLIFRTAGSAGDDTLWGSFYYTSVLVGREGNDVLRARNGGDTVLGGDGDDVLTKGGLMKGGDGDDTIKGYGGSTFIGGEGADVLVASSGDVTLKGGPGDDLFRFEESLNGNVIEDFGAGAGGSAGVDRIDLHLLSKPTGSAPLTADDILIEDVGNDTHISLDHDHDGVADVDNWSDAPNTITLLNVDASQIDRTDIIL